MSPYFDFNATTPLSAVARDAWLLASQTHWQNPSSLYRDAGFTSQKLEAARERLATLLGCDDAERIVFTSGTTESNNALFFSIARSLPKDARIAISTIEHPSVREAARAVFRDRIIEIPVNQDGVVELERVHDVLQNDRPALVSIMAANNESGTLQPWREISALCKSSGVFFHTDAAQWIGKLPSGDLGHCDSISGSGHKFGGPKGVGFLVLRDPAQNLSFLRGGPQEQGHRAGTENYPSIEAMVAALEWIEPRLDAVVVEQTLLREEFCDAMRHAFPGVRFIGRGTERLWNTVLMVMPEHENLKWLTRLSRRGFSISTGSACSSGKEGSSVVVQALGASADDLRRVVRVSGGWDHTRGDWQALAGAFVEVQEELKRGGKGQP
jgi:cysteine desulfurase